jgi:hypothetical protein
MPIDFDDDLTEMLSDDDHGETAIHNHRRITGIFNDEFYEQSQGVGIESSEPAFYLADRIAETIQHRDPIKIRNVDYVVVGKQPDKTGLTRLVLRDA